MDTYDFEPVRILDNFYQTSSYFPMPVVLVSTVSESGDTNIGPYSLCFPHIVAEDHSMILICRSNSNTGQIYLELRYVQSISFPLARNC